MNAYQTKRRRAMAKRFPNAADKSYFLGKLADNLLICASCIGIITVVFFLLTM